MLILSPPILPELLIFLAETNVTSLSAKSSPEFNKSPTVVVILKLPFLAIILAPKAFTNVSVLIVILFLIPCPWDCIVPLLSKFLAVIVIVPIPFG